MKHTFLLACLFTFSCAFAQENPAYKAWIKEIRELPVKDSITIVVPGQAPGTNDDAAVQKYAGPLYSPPAAGSGNSFSYQFTGKMTGHREYDIVLLYKYSYRNEKFIFRNLFLVTLNKKTGKLLHYQMVADNSVYQQDHTRTDCRFYKEGRFILTTDRTIKDNTIHSEVEFLIHQQGTIVYKPKPGAIEEHHD